MPSGAIRAEDSRRASRLRSSPAMRSLRSPRPSGSFWANRFALFSWDNLSLSSSKPKSS
jgi:hypothetical protein